jgi:hypothetical protein
VDGKISGHLLETVQFSLEFLLSHLLESLWSSTVGMLLIIAIPANKDLGKIRSTRRAKSRRRQSRFSFLNLDESLVSMSGSSLKKTFTLIKANVIAKGKTS